MLNNHILEKETLSLVSDNFRLPLHKLGLPNHGGLVATSEKALQFRQEIDNMEEMLQNTNTINFEELHSESQRTERKL